MDTIGKSRFNEREMMELEQAERELMIKRRQLEADGVATSFAVDVMTVYGDCFGEPSYDSRVYDKLKAIQDGLPEAVHVTTRITEQHEVEFILTTRQENGFDSRTSSAVSAEVASWLIHNRYLF